MTIPGVTINEEQSTKTTLHEF